MNSTTQSSSPYAPELAMFGAQREQATLPILQQLASQIGESLRTGGIGAQQPIINRAQDAARAAFSQTQTQTAEDLARRNIGGSQAAQILGNQRMAGGQQIAGIGPGIAQQFAGMAPGVGMDTGGLGALGQAGGLTRTSTYTPSFWDSFNQALQTGAGIGGSFGGGGFGFGGGGGAPWPMDPEGYPIPYTG